MIQRIPWTEKPPEGTPINMAHPMAADLFFFCAMDRPGNQIDLVHNREGTFIQNGANVVTTQVMTPQGLVANLEMSGNDEHGWDFGNTGGSGYYEPTELTVITQVRLGNEVNSGGSRVISKRTTAGGNDIYAILFLSTSDIRFRINALGDSIVRDSGTFVGALMDLAMAADTVGQDNYVWEPETDYFEELVGQTGATLLGQVGNLCVGHRQAENRQFDGDIHYVALFNRKKTKAFIEHFRANPWQIFEPLRVPGFAADVAAPSEISASLPIVFDVVADLKAAGQLDAAIQTALSLVADLKAAGELDAAIALALTVAADLKAAGQLDAAANLAFSIVGDLKAAGQVAAAADLAFSIAADLRAAGQLDAAIDLTFSIVADLKSAPGLGRSYTRRLLGVIHE